MSVRDRIKAAEQVSGSDNAQNARPLVRRGTRLSLNTDEHIKEEFLRRGDGGWHKRVDIGQHQKFVAPPLIPPVIKLTAETPLVTTPTQQLPGKIDLPRAFDMNEPIASMAPADTIVLSPKDSTKGLAKNVVKEIPSEAPKPPALEEVKSTPAAPVEEDWQRVERQEAEQQHIIDLAEGKARHEEWDRVAAMEAAQQAEMDAAAILAEAEKDEAENKPRSKKSVAKERHKEWDDVAAKEAKQQARMDADEILADLAKDEAAKRKLDLEAEALLAEFEREEAARKKKVPGAFEDEPEPEIKRASPLAPAPTAPKIVEMPEPPRKQSTRNIPTNRFKDLLDEDVIIDEPLSHPRTPPSERKKSRAVQIEDEEEEVHFAKPKLSPREKILFDPIEYQKKKQARHERRASRQQVKSEPHVVVEEVEEKPRSHSRTVRSPSILLVHTNDDDERSSHRSSHSHKHKHRSRSGSHVDHEELSSRHSQSHHSQDDHRRSSNSLWPSFSSSERRSVSEMLDPSAHIHSSHHRKSSDSQSTASARSEMSVRKLEAVEYIAGKKLDHIPLSPPKSPTRPAGFVRSRSHTGEYSEGFTHDKKLLRKPDEDEIVDHVDHDWEPKHRKSSSRHSHSKSKDEPWQVKLLNGIARS